VKSVSFRQAFQFLTDNDPYAWQEQLYCSFCDGNLPDQISLPTGAGKTQIITCWCLALVKNQTLPRRLVYVVDRRSVVDQSTKVVEELVARLQNAEANSPVAELLRHLPNGLGASTLRGEFVDNKEWSTFPHRPSVVCGTVDMVGSRLLFSGYGDGPYSRALHAGLLGNDTMIVFDECHLVPAFAMLLQNVKNAGGKLKPFHYVLMSATSDGAGLELAEADLANPRFRQRFMAKKTIQIVRSSQVDRSIVSLAETDPPKRTIIFVESPTTAVQIAEQLLGSVVLLTGTMRGKERDDLVDNPVFQAFTKVEEPTDPHYLVATSAGEVGIDLTCSKMITDVTTAQSLVQRFGRCARFGECDGQIYIVSADNAKEKARFGGDLDFVLDLGGDASCANLWAKRRELAALSRTPETIPTLEPRVLDILAMTSLHNDIPVDEYIRGRQWDQRYVDIVFREEAALLAEMPEMDFDFYLKHFPVLSFEKLSERASRVQELAKDVLEERSDVQCALILADGQKKGVWLSELPDIGLTNCTLIVPEQAGFGLHSGMLVRSNSDATLDVSTIEHKHHPARVRLILLAAEEYAAAKGEAVAFDRIVGDKRIVIVKTKVAKDYSTELLSEHSDAVCSAAKQFAEKAVLDDELVAAIAEAGQFHDFGKANPIWQLAAKSGNVKRPIAKTWYVSAPKLAGFRHEFESMDSVPAGLVRHLVAAHHAGARPTWTGKRDLAPVLQDENKAYAQILRFAELQKRYGWWGLAYLEAVLRCADAYVSGE
jgi:CRISPR-associated endonuclease/helicase Cas3